MYSNDMGTKGTSNTTAIYVRISADPQGERAGVERQRRECEDLAERLGLVVVAVYEDNDVSAYSGKPRPAFERLLADADTGDFCHVVAWSSDRLYRRVADLTRITDELAAKAKIHTVAGGDVDLETAEGILRAQVLGSVGEFESRRKAERVAARARQRAEQGVMTATTRPIGWRWREPCPGDVDCRHKTPCNGDGTRAKFGTRAGLVIDPDEAVLLTDSYAMVKDGASLNATFRRFRESGGQLGDPSTLRKALLNPRNAGLVAHGGVVVAEAADGHAIVDRDTFDRVTAILKDPSRRTAPGRPSHTLLGKSLHCGLCGSTMAASRKVGRPTYVCVKNQHLVIVRDLVDKPVLELVGRIVAGLADAGVLTMPDPTGDAAVQLLRDQAADIESRLDGLSGLLAAGDLDPVDYAAATRKLRDRLAGIAAQLTRRSGRPALASLNGHSGGVTAAWNQVVADARDGRVDGLRAIMAELLDGIDLFRGRRAVLRWKTWVDLPATDLQLTTRRAWDRDERRAAVRRLHDDGMTQLDIAATLQINRSTVWKDLKATA